MKSFNLLTQLHQVDAGMRKTLGAIGGVNSPEMIGSAVVLRKAWRGVLSTRGGGSIASSIKSRRLRAVGGTPSRPGEAPRRQTGGLAKSVMQRAVRDVRRVAVAQFTAPLLEGGVNSSLPLRSGSRRRRAGQARRRLVILPRPSGDRALASAKQDMGDVFAQRAALRTYVL